MVPTTAELSRLSVFSMDLTVNPCPLSSSICGLITELMVRQSGDSRLITQDGMLHLGKWRCRMVFSTALNAGFMGPRFL